MQHSIEKYYRDQHRDAGDSRQTFETAIEDSTQFSNNIDAFWLPKDPGVNKVYTVIDNDDEDDLISTNKMSTVISSLNKISGVEVFHLTVVDL